MSALRMPPRLPAPRNPQLDFKQRNLFKPYRFPPCNAGLNLKDAVSDMKPGDALRLDNLIPGPDGISTRHGRDVWTPSVGPGIRSLIEFSAPDAEYLFAVTGTGYMVDVSNPGPYAAAPAPNQPYNAGIVQHAQIQSSAGTFLMCVTGYQPPFIFSTGGGWAAHSMTYAADPSIIYTLNFVAPHMGRLWFSARRTTDLYYLGPAQIGGALTKFSVGSLLRRGGYVVALGTLTRDGGLGSDDLFVIISSEGEVLTYAGNNPASVNTWGLVGVYQISPPVGPRCLSRMGADLAVLTTQGIVPLAQTMAIPASLQGKASLTDRINTMLKEMHVAHGDEFGWELHEYPAQNLVIANVPMSATESFPYVMHAETGGWCRFTNYNSLCFATHKGRLLSGSPDGAVHEYSTTYTDIDQPILCEMMTSFDMMGSPGLKTVNATRPVFKGPTTSSLPVMVFTDYNSTTPITEIGHINTGGPPWNITAWGPTTGTPANEVRPPWGGRSEPVADWQANMGYGTMIAVAMKFYANDATTITGIGVLYEESLPL